MAVGTVLAVVMQSTYPSPRPGWLSPTARARLLPIPEASDEGGLHSARKYQPSTRPVKGPKILWPRRSRMRITPTRMEPLHGQSILEVLRTKPWTAPAPGQ